MRISGITILTTISLVASVVVAEAPAPLDPGKDFSIRLQVAESHLRAGKAEAALQEFLIADEMVLFEVPNYQVLVGIAEAKCRLGEAEAGLVDLEGFVCAVRVARGELPCYLEEYNSYGQPKDNPALNELCRTRMCGEIYLPYYESKDPEVHEELAAFKARAERVREICEQALDSGSKPPPDRSSGQGGAQSRSEQPPR